MSKEEFTPSRFTKPNASHNPRRLRLLHLSSSYHNSQHSLHHTFHRMSQRQSISKSPGRRPTSSRQSSASSYTSADFIHTSSLLNLRIAGLDHHFDLSIEPTSTLAALKSEIERRTELPAEYLRLVARHKKLDDDSMVLGGTIMDETGIKEIGIGLENGTKILLLHSANYFNDKVGVEQLNTLNKEIDKVDAGRKDKSMDNKTVHELITQLCCKIDGVETNGSEALRKMRKQTIRRAEGVAKKSDESKRGIDP